MKRVWTLALAVISVMDMGLGAQGLPFEKSVSAVSYPADVTEVSAPASVDADTAAKKWTVMVYINGRNDLAKAGVYDLNEMEAVGSTGDMNIVAELGYYRERTRRYLVTKDEGNAPERITSKLLGEITMADMGDWKHLVEFALWAKANYPAERYMLVIWNHGDGWKMMKGISYDQMTNNHITTPELGAAMKYIGKVDILAMDACLMQMAEVAFEVKDHADMIVASEEVVPGYGYPYDAVLGRMSRMTGASNEEIAANIVEQYGKFYSAMGKPVTLSAIKAARLDSLAGLLNGWVKRAMQLPNKKMLRDILKETDTFHLKDYKDLSHFISLAGERAGDEELRVRGEVLVRFISEELVTAKTSLRKDSHGISVQLASTGSSDNYSRLAWSRATLWDEFLEHIEFHLFSSLWE